MRSRCLALLLLALALGGCVQDPEAPPAEPAPAESAAAAAPAPVSCARVSATDLSTWVGVEMMTSDLTEESGSGGTTCSAVGEPGSLVGFDWSVEEAPGSAAPRIDTEIVVQGAAAGGLTTTVRGYRNPDLGEPETTEATLRAAAEQIVAAYAVPGEPAPEGDQCHLLSDADVSALAGFPVEVRDQVASGQDLDCTTLVGDGEDQDGLATLRWSLTPPSETLTAAAGGGFGPSEAITLPGGEPAVISYESGRAVVAAQAGERTIVVDVDALVDEDEFPEARIRELAGDIADAYAG